MNKIETTRLDHLTRLMHQSPISFSENKKEKIKEMIDFFLNALFEGTVKWDKNVIYSLTRAIRKLDELISSQLSELMHHEKFRSLEGAWRGLHYLTHHTATGSNLKIKALNLSKKYLHKDLSKSSDFDQSQLFKIVYEKEFGTPGGEPYGILLGDYRFDHSPEDVELLNKLSNVAAAAFCPFVSAASPALFGLDSFSQLGKPRDLEKIFDGKEYIKWNALRESEDARFIVLTLPSVLARLPYGAKASAVDAFSFEEVSAGIQNRALPHDHYCWVNAAYALVERVTASFTTYQWCTAIRGAEGGGKVKNLPLHVFMSEEADLEVTCPTEVAITDRRESELSRLGFLPLCHYKNTDYAVFFGSQTLQKPTQYDNPSSTANAAISSRLTYIMATARFAHYLKIIGRDKIGLFVNVNEAEMALNNWILNYVNANADSGQEMKAKYPLAEAKIEVVPVPGKPGFYHAIAWLRPWLQLEALTASLRLVAAIPKINQS